MMKKINYLLFLLLINISVSAFAQQKVKFEVNVPLTVVAGSNFQVSYVLEDASGEDFRLNGDFEKLNVFYGPSISRSSSVTIINGKRSSNSSITYTYTLSAPEEGTYVIPQASIVVNGKTYQTKSVSIKALPMSHSQGQTARQQSRPATSQDGGVPSQSQSKGGTISSDDLFVRIDLTKQKVYEQEALVATFKLYSLVDVISLVDAKFPEFKGFVSEEFDLPTNRQFKLENYNGKNYYTIDIKKTLLFPQQSGKLTIPSGSITLIASVPSGKYVRDFFGVVELKEKVEKVLKTKVVDVEVLKLPEDGKPLNFSNAVGDFNLKTQISQNQIQANNSLTYKIDISGVGNLKLMTNPKVEFPKEFEFFDPKITNTFNLTASGQSGKRTIEYTLIPRFPGEYNIPALNFSYFDPNSKTYKVLTTSPTDVKVEIDPSVKESVQTTQNENKISEYDLNNIRPLDKNQPLFKNYEDIQWGNTETILWYSIPVGLLIILFIIFNKRAKSIADVEGTRRKKANRMAVKRLKKAYLYLKQNNKELFYEECTKALWFYLSHKLNIPASQLNRENIELTLQSYNIQENLIKDIITTLDECEFERFAPVSSSRALKPFYEEMIELISKLERELKLSRK